MQGHSPHPVQLARALRDERRDDSCWFSVRLAGRAREPQGRAPNGAAGFVRAYRVVASSADEACAFASALEPERRWAALEVAGVEDAGAAEGELLGVAEASEPIWHRET